MAKDPAFLFYASDFLTGTMFFSDAQVGKYIRLLCCQHQHGGLIEKNTFDSIVGTDNILRSKFIESEYGYYNMRLSAEMESRHKKSDNISKAAKETWEKRKKDTIVIQSYNNPTTIPIRPEDENEDEIDIVNDNVNTLMSDFEIFRKQYEGTKRGLVTEFKTFQKHKDWKQVIPLLLPALLNQKRARVDLLTAKKFIPEWKNLQTWLNQRCWEEEIKTHLQPEKPIRDDSWG